ncbi:MAG: hypothetical protein EZS28_048094 [Streblomastix strix]|uniref:Uncharacterized protein n=1 Tax=Streblomastix strix TaxID=222440 RepID=A0A5J4TE22_9EUKA|nr:MAG: hypothetical protein EZS28_048094 [Streblomastix strix]
MSAAGDRTKLKDFDQMYQLATNIGLEYNATGFEIFKIFETLIEYYTLREEEKQEFQKLKNYYTFTEQKTEKTIDVINYLHYLNHVMSLDANARQREQMANILETKGLSKEAIRRLNPDPAADPQEPESNN